MDQKKQKYSQNHQFFIVLIAILFFVLAVFFAIVLEFRRHIDLVCANSISCIKNISGESTTQKVGEYLGQTVDVPQILANYPDHAFTLGESTGVNKHIYVDLETQHLYAYENDHIIMDFPVSTGKWGKTPIGDFQIWIKLRSTLMAGGNKNIGTYYYLPNVPYTMYFYNDQIPKTRGYGLHGAYWHNNFGHPMSHGCINISPSNAEALYNWADPVAISHSTLASDLNPGTVLTIFGVAPKE